MPFRALIASLATSVLVTLLLTAGPAWAAKGGEGLYGKTDDKVITNFGYGLMIFFTLLVCLLTAAQYLLERRKHK